LYQLNDEDKSVTIFLSDPFHLYYLFTKALAVQKRVPIYLVYLSTYFLINSVVNLTMAL